MWYNMSTQEAETEEDLCEFEATLVHILSYKL